MSNHKAALTEATTLQPFLKGPYLAGVKALVEQLQSAITKAEGKESGVSK